MAAKNSSKFFALLCVLCPSVALLSAQTRDLRLGIIGLDTSHAVEFTKLLNDPQNPDHVPGARLVAAFPGGSPDLPSSADRVLQYTATLRDQWKVEIVADIATLVKGVDAVLLLSVDGRPHLAQIRPVLAARKPVFIDKPLAASLKDAREIFRLCAQARVPCFSASALRFYAPIEALKAEVGQIQGVDAFSPAPLEPHHPDLFWYGIHGVEILYTLMGPGCQWVQRTYHEGQEIVTGQWKDGRIGTFRGIRDGKHDYGAIAFGSKGIAFSGPVKGALYKRLVQEIVRFFQTGTPPVQPEETLEMFAFMEAAQRSRDGGGAKVILTAVSP